MLVNDTLTEFCADRGIDFTRSRACRKNHQAWVKQKSGAVTRRLPGHERCSRQVAGQTLDRLHGAIRLYVNFFQPSFKLMEKTRQGSVEAKSYTSPATPQERLIQHERFGAEARASMNERRAPVEPGGQTALHSGTSGGIGGQRVSGSQDHSKRREPGMVPDQIARPVAPTLREGVTPGEGEIPAQLAYTE